MCNCCLSATCVTRCSFPITSIVAKRESSKERRRRMITQRLAATKMAKRMMIRSAPTRMETPQMQKPYGCPKCCGGVLVPSSGAYACQPLLSLCICSGPAMLSFLLVSVCLTASTVCSLVLVSPHD